MSRMLSKMNLISVVQQLPSEDIETIKGYVEMIENENEELKKQLEEKEEWIKLLSMFKKQQKEFIKYLKDMLDDENDIFSVVRVKDVLQKYKEITGD